MVPIKTKSLPKDFERIETNLKYLIDLDLSDDEILKDPLALAFYYHFIEQNKTQNINKVSLVSWARTYCYEKLVQGKLSKKKDTEITAAILTFSTLKADNGYAEDKKREIENSVNELLKKERDKDGLFFGRPNFTAIILYATNQAGIPIKNEKETLLALIERYKNNQTFNNLIGLPFLTRLLIKQKKATELKEIIGKIGDKLKNHLLEYDDKLYLVHSLWAYYSQNNSLLEIKDVVESTIEETPIMVSDIINKGDISDITVRQDNLKISRLYKAIFLDLITEYETHAGRIKEKELDKKYSGEFTLKWGAFATFSIIPFVITLIVGFALKHSLKTGLAFWILQQTQTTWNALVLNTLSLIVVAYLVTFSVMGVYSLYTSIIGKKLVKDLRVWEYYKHHQKKTLKWFCITLGSALILGIITQLGATALQNFLTKK